jgi:glutamate-1-semialdehyde 2,1-aminomutase
MRYQNSIHFLEEALKVIPLGSQTFSKSITQYPRGVSPLFIQSGEGVKVVDVDGNIYTDFVCSLASINIGYNDKDIKDNVKKQLDVGTIFSLPCELEITVAKLITETVPCAEMVRFGKNGSDATSAAVRIARSYTGREKVAICGYHGWHDWYVGSTTRNKGIPKAVCDLSLKFVYNNIQSLEELFFKNKNEIACVIMEPFGPEMPKEGFLHDVQKLCKQEGALFILDEVVTGFRVAPGGAQELLGIVPDLCTLGKGMANGYPISAICGKREFMKECEEIFFSGTFGGELLSLAAAQATINKVKTRKVCEHTSKIGSLVKEGVKNLITLLDIGDFITISGHETWSFLSMKDIKKYSSFEIKTLFLQEIFKRGILTIGTHNIAFSHMESDVLELIGVYEEVFTLIKKTVSKENLHDILQVKPLVPLFKVR